MTHVDPASFDDPYHTVLELVAQHPGSTVDELTAYAADRDVDADTATDLLSTAVENDDILTADNRYWVMRTGRYAFDQYDHPES